MWAWILLSVAVCTDCFKHENRTQLYYGRELVIPLSWRAVVLYFTPVDSFHTPIPVWNTRDPLLSQGRGRVDGRRWIIDGVTFEDQGKYTQWDAGNHILSTVILTVREERHYYNRAVNGSMSIPLHIPLVDTQLSFVPEGGEGNFTLVHRGAIVTRDERYSGRLQLRPNRIVMEDLVLEDSGHYEIRDRQLKLVSSTKLHVSETLDDTGNAYLSLLALLGLGGGICFCCVKRKKCCKKKGPHIQNDSAQPSPGPADGCDQVTYHPSPNVPSDPHWNGPQPELQPVLPPNYYGPQPGPQPNYYGPQPGPQPNYYGPQPGPQPNYYGPPSDWSGNPQNRPIMYPPPSPSQPHWNPGPQPVAYTTAVYSAPPTAAEPAKEEAEKEATVTDSLTEHAEEAPVEKPPPSPSMPVNSDSLHSTDAGPRFQISLGGETKDSTTLPSSTYTSETINFL